MEVIKNKRILALVGIVCLILGVFMPYVTITIWGYSSSLSLWGYWEGKVVLVLTLANALFIFQDFIEKYVPQLFNNSVGTIVRKANNPKFALIPTILVAAFAVWMLMEIEVDSEFIKHGLGFWVLWIGVVALIGHSIFYKKQNIETVQPPQVQPTNYQQQPIQPVNNFQQPQVEPAKKYCPYCRNEVEINSEFCPSCWNRF